MALMDHCFEYNSAEELNEVLMDAVEKWHELGDDISLYDYLGFTWDEYTLWAMNNNMITAIVSTRLANLVTEAALEKKRG